MTTVNVGKSINLSINYIKESLLINLTLLKLSLKLTSSPKLQNTLLIIKYKGFTLFTLQSSGLFLLT